MTSRHLSRLIIGLAILALTVTLLFDGPTGSAAPGGKGSAPPAPSNLVITAITETSVSLAWQGSTSKSSLSYRVRITNLNNSLNTALATASQTTYTAKFLTPNSNYTFVVYAVDSKGNQSADSNVASGQTLPDTAPPTTPVLQATVLGPSQVQLTWTKSTDNVANNCCNFSFTMNGSPLTQHINWATATAADKLSVIIRHIQPGSTNSFSVKVGDYGGNVATSNTVNATTPPSNDVTPPTAPANVHLVDFIGCELNIGWAQASDETDPQDQIEYEIYVNGVLSPLPVSAGVDVDFVYGFFGDNIFTVKAVDRSGNSSPASSPLKLFLGSC